MERVFRRCRVIKDTFLLQSIASVLRAFARLHGSSAAKIEWTGVRGQPFCLLLGRRTMQRPPRGILLRAQRLDALARRGGCRGGRRGSARGRAWAPAKVRNSFPQPSVAGARERRSASSLRVRRLTCVCGGGGGKGGGHTRSPCAVVPRGAARCMQTKRVGVSSWCKSSPRKGAALGRNVERSAPRRVVGAAGAPECPKRRESSAARPTASPPALPKVELTDVSVFFQGSELLALVTHWALPRACFLAGEARSGTAVLTVGLVGSADSRKERAWQQHA